VAGGHGVGAVHVAVARQAQHRGVGPAVHHRPGTDLAVGQGGLEPPLPPRIL
jgi:hypothetical protein